MSVPRRLTTSEELDVALGGSSSRTLVLFKHSTRCPASSRAHAEFLCFVGNSADDGVESAIVYVVEERPLSIEVAARLEVRHESPQAFLIKDGAVAWHASHDSITREALTSAVAALG